MENSTFNNSNTSQLNTNYTAPTNALVKIEKCLILLLIMGETSTFDVSGAYGAAL